MGPAPVRVLTAATVAGCALLAFTGCSPPGRPPAQPAARAAEHTSVLGAPPELGPTEAAAAATNRAPTTDRVATAVTLLRAPERAATEIETLVRRVSSSVVQLTAPMPVRTSLKPLRVVEGDPFEVVRAGPLGTAVVVGRGMLLTAAHVVEHAGTVRGVTPGGRPFSATVVASDRPHDLALLKVSGDASGLEPLRIGERAPHAGEAVVALGNLYGSGPTVTLGVVTSSRGDATGNADALETDLAINLTNTGGPIVNLAGEVVGIANAKLTEQRGMRGLGYGSAANHGGALLTQARLDETPLRKHPLPDVSPLRGVVTDDLKPELRKRFAISSDLNHGAVVMRVEHDSPAAAVGIEPGDVFVEVDFVPVWTSDGFAQSKRTASGPLLVLVVRGNAAAYVLLHP